MTDERIRIVQEVKDDRLWLIFYQGYIDLPEQSWANIEGEGTTSIYVSERLDEKGTLAQAIAYAREWGQGSGFIVRPPKIEAHGSAVQLKLVRP